MVLKEVSQTDLIEGLRKGDEKALTEIFRLYWKRLYYMALRRTGSHETAEEIVQDLLTDLWDKRLHLFNSTESSSSLPAYLLTAVKNKILNHIRSQVYRKEYCEYYSTILQHDEKSTEEQVEFNQLEDELNKGIQKLPEKTKKVFRLSRLEGRSIPEIASQLNISEKAIEYHLTKSLKTMRFHLKDFIVPLFFIVQIILEEKI